MRPAIVSMVIGIALGGAVMEMACKRSHKAEPNVTYVAEPTAVLPPPTPSQLSQARAFGHTFAVVASRMSPSVVSVTVTTMLRAPRRLPFPFGNPFYDGPLDRNQDDEEHDETSPRQMGMGSGVVIDTNGHILTNNHVVEGADEVVITFSDGKAVNGKVVGADSRTDLAVIKVNATGIAPAKLGDSDKIEVGEWVIAIGNPFGLDHTVTVGVLSAKNRSGFHSGHYEDFLQTDASINPGNSGGPLVSLDGEVIGINAMIAGQGTGIGFAVPTSIAKPVADQLIAHGKVTRAYLGLMMQPITRDLKGALGAGAPEKGAIVTSLEEDSPAEKAGIKAGDVITSIDGIKVDGPRTLQRYVLSKHPGEEVELVVFRKGKTLHMNAKLEELPGDHAPKKTSAVPEETDAQPKELGLELRPMSDGLADRFLLDRDQPGLVVVTVEIGSKASIVGLREGDLLEEIDGAPVTSVDDTLKKLTSARRGGHLIRIRRGPQSFYRVLGA